VKRGFSNDQVSSNDNCAVKFTEDKEDDDWHSPQSLEAQSEDYPTFEGAVEVYGVRHVDQVSHQYLTMPEESK
jgi:hypothetical protein